MTSWGVHYEPNRHENADRVAQPRGFRMSCASRELVHRLNGAAGFVHAGPTVSQRFPHSGKPGKNSTIALHASASETSNLIASSGEGLSYYACQPLVLGHLLRELVDKRGHPLLVCDLVLLRLRRADVAAG
jgi:hypothetical protein